jgi:nickel-dependent lactate racemase
LGNRSTDSRLERRRAAAETQTRHSRILGPIEIGRFMPLLDISFPYGASGHFSCSVRAEQVLRHHRAPPALDHLPEDVTTCLRRPLDFPALTQAILSDDRVVIALDDHTPSAPALIRGCWDVLSSRIEPENVLILQQAPDGDPGLSDPRCELPDKIADQVQLACHDSSDPKNRAYLATSTAGERIYLARQLVDADFVICVGMIGYDPLLGFRGTNSVLYPGLSTADAIRKTRGQGHDELGPDDTRILRQTIDEVGWLLGVQFSLQVVPAARTGVAHDLAGASEAVFENGKQLLSKHWEVAVSERAETVVVGIDDLGNGQGWPAIAAALDSARQLVVQEGRVVVLSQIDSSLTPGLEMIRDSRTPRDALQPLRLTTPDDVVVATRIAKAIDWANVYLQSRLEDDLVEELFMIPWSDTGQSHRLLEASQSLTFIESAQYTYGRLTPGT